MAKTKNGSKPNSRSGSKKNTPVNTPTKKNPKLKAANNKAPKKDDLPIPKARIDAAISELRKFSSKKDTEDEDSKKNLLDDDEDSTDDLNKSFQLITVNNKSFTGTTKSFKLKMLPVPHSLYKSWKKASVTSVKDFKTLLILKDDDISKVAEDDLFDKLNESDITIDQIISGKDLKTVYKAFEKRRAFISEFSLILADENIITTLPKLLGGKFYNKVETTPISIRSYSSGKVFSIETLTNSIKKVYLNQLPVSLPRGTTMNVHLGNLQWFDNKELSENVTSITKKLLETYPLRSIFIKTNKSPVLPLYYNQDVLNEIAASAESKANADNNGREIQSVKIDGMDVKLTAFDKALLEITNPDEVSTVFAKQINATKRAREDEKDEKVEKDDEKMTTKKAKKA
ncbi:hypothetical protein TBLA_0A10390 [Henningerozyma blattae CBS 6284]|uniref:Proteasome-interacting protein CIC1 n=1 Tax=Henningerozyma blattae (strain ATCC 34711 / CBS 6284 / DSM 70876 / NBRC 10599 / NRRL Y-10934 / UCD 77-7) TaxID=1071380 RepID=I2GXG5_HENB6|nr:hypothetical protein TBLA_0A10390 [Tetrapisispora blattae CBS 6284]CCH58817.1 hypothetical protein TBLA_0A10390 [Tetrapisispora blattae CBS 6284]